ncbi:membrane hypothetical protein [Tenacibaculum sediminilitoris]|uniref:hypothetical protein n=1 Tax=Tenacibaculum sediminilitoris TaxID=1820334 RepID=UPI00389393A3
MFFFSELQVKINAENNFLNALTWCPIFFPLAYLEEIIFRGQGFTKLKSVLGIRATQFIFAIIFTYYYDATGTTFISQLLDTEISTLIFWLGSYKKTEIIGISMQLVVFVVRIFLTEKLIKKKNKV